ncbi:MAG: DUF58 domain-containing protein [Phycisphaerales bacterium]|nr:DUF58 domain-containing protein [Phycisphaerales bacterium]
MNTATGTRLRSPEELARIDFEMVVRRLADDLAFGSDNSLFMGGGLEYASSRPYQPGDSVRLLNWRLSARTGQAFTKEYEALKRTNVHILVDTSASMVVGSTALTKHDIAVWAAGAIGLVAQRRLSPVAIIGAGDREVRAAPSLARNDLWRALEPLRLPDRAEGTRLSERLGVLLAHASRQSVIIVLSDLHDPDAVSMLRKAGHLHDCAVIHLQDPSETGALRAGFFHGRESETATSFLGWSGRRWASTDEVRRDLVRAGIDHLHLGTEDPLVPRLRHFLESRGGLARGTR